MDNGNEFGAHLADLSKVFGCFPRDLIIAELNFMVLIYLQLPFSAQLEEEGGGIEQNALGGKLSKFLKMGMGGGGGGVFRSFSYNN